MRGIVWRQLGSDPGQVENTSNGAHQVIVRDDLFEIERIEKLSLILTAKPPSLDAPSVFASDRRNHCSAAAAINFAVWVILFW